MSEVNVKEHLNNLIDALVALAPSRNYVTQMLYVVHMTEGKLDFPTLHDAYPELLRDRETREALAKIFGITFGETVRLEYSKYGYAVAELINSLFARFEDKEFVEPLNLLLKDIRAEPLPNLREEWIRLKLEGVSKESTYGKEAMEVLKTIAEGKYPTISDLTQKGMEEVRVRRIIDLLKDKYRLIKEGSGYVEELKTTKVGLELSDELKRYSSLLAKISS